jgi:hypothetical protein
MDWKASAFQSMDAIDSTRNHVFYGFSLLFRGFMRVINPSPHSFSAVSARVPSKMKNS